jgi:hypothetical protein
MGYCNQCSQAKPILTCTETLIIGEVVASEDYFVYIENNNTGFIVQQAVSVGVDGVLEVDLTLFQEGFISENFTYTIWAVKDGDGLNQYAPITVEELEYECFLLTFNNAYNDNIRVSQTAISIEV